MKKWLKRIGLAIVVLFMGLAVGFYVYTLDYYRADEEALQQYEDKGFIAGSVHSFLNEETDTGLILYPGGKVEARAYAVLASRLQAAGLNVFIADMPFNLAVFDIHAANDIRTQNPTISRWFMAGHSLGGAMASSHVNRYPEVYQGIIYLAAYPLNDASLPRLILYGDQDGVLSLDQLDPFKDEAIVLQGGNHANFANYGPQAGDGEGSLIRVAQQNLTVELIMEFILNN